MDWQPELNAVERGAAGWGSGSTEISLRNSQAISKDGTNGTKLSNQDNAKRSAQRVAAAVGTSATSLKRKAEVVAFGDPEIVAEMDRTRNVSAALLVETPTDFLIAGACPRGEAGR